MEFFRINNKQINIFYYVNIKTPSFRYGNRKDHFLKKHGKIEDMHIFYSSLTSGVIASFITTPLWVVKTRLILNR